MSYSIKLIPTLFIFFVGISVTQSQILVSSIMLVPMNGNTISNPGETKQILAAINPSNADDMSVTWSVVNNPGSATISQNGLLTPGTDGFATVTATANDGSGVSGSIVITITNQPATIVVTAVDVFAEGGSTTINTSGQLLQMYAVVTPSNASDPSVTWGLTNVTGSATIDQNGLVTPVSNGSVVVTATSNFDQTIVGSALITISQLAGVNDLELFSVATYPNPVKDIIIVENMSEEAPNVISVYSIEGEKVHSMISNKPTEQINLEHLNSGVYFLNIESSESITVLRFIRE